MVSIYSKSKIFNAISTTAYDTLNTQLDKLESLLSTVGIRVMGSSRFKEYRKIISSFYSIATGKKPLQKLDIKLLHQALYEMREFIIIIEEFTKSPEIHNWHSTFQKVVSGQKFPEDEDSSSSGRDFQFELYIAAIFRKSGYEIELEEPDIIVKAKSLTFGIAAKRPKSIRRLEQNIRKANRQIINSNFSGIVALDISRIQNPSNYIAYGEEPKFTVDAARQFTDHFVEKNSTKIRSIVDPNCVFGILICMSVICLVGPNFHQAGISTGYTLSNLVDPSDSRFDFLSLLVKNLSNSLP